MLKPEFCMVESVPQHCRSQRKVLSLPAQSSATVGAKFSRCSRKVLPLRWHCIATEAGELCQRSSRTLRQQWENFYTEIAELCYRSSLFKTTQLTFRLLGQEQINQ